MEKRRKIYNGDGQSNLLDIYRKGKNKKHIKSSLCFAGVPNRGLLERWSDIMKKIKKEEGYEELIETEIVLVIKALNWADISTNNSELRGVVGPLSEKEGLSEVRRRG